MRHTFSVYFPMKAKRILLLPSLALIICLAGCGVKIVNTTPPTFPASPTGTYKLSALAELKNSAVQADSLEAFVVIDGQQNPMTLSADSPNLFEYNYQAPSDKELTRFYYVLNFVQKTRDQSLAEVQIISDIYRVILPNPITLSLQAPRAAIGTRTSVLGEKFAETDIIFVGSMPAETIFISASELQFIVPEVTPGFGHKVEVRSITRAQTAGYLRVDRANPLSVLPSKLTLQSGQRVALAFALTNPAPYGGLYINVTTDIPDCIIMPEVIIPEGARTVSATLEGGKVGSGQLFINATDIPELVIPVTVE